MTLELTSPPSRIHIGALAGAFADVLDLWLSPAEIRQMRLANVDHQDDQICASHDFCDANMAMLEAFQTTFGVEPRLELLNGQDGVDVALWGQAWELAKTSWLTAANAEISADAARSDGEILILFSDQDGRSLMTVDEFTEHLSAGETPAEVGRIRNRLLTSRSYEGGGGAAPIWTAKITDPAQLRHAAADNCRKA